MLKIGDFSKLGQVSVKTLRYYDEVGLLQPDHVDAFTGYRYYRVEQLPRLNTILALKDLGLALDQIKTLLAGGLPPAELRSLLRQKQAELSEHVTTEQARLARVAARLRQLEQVAAPAYEVVLKPVAPQPVASLRATLPHYGAIGGLFQELIGHLSAQGATISIPIGLYYDAEYQERDVDVEAAIGTDASARGSDRIRIYDLLGTATMATAIHQGPYDQITGAYAALFGWVNANGYVVAGPLREYYLRGPFTEPDAANYVTEVQVPVTRST